MGGISRLFLENFLSHSAENFRRGILYCCNNFGYRKSLDKGGGSITLFRRSFSLTVPTYFIGEHFGVSEKFFYRKFSCIGGGASRFCRNFLSHRTETKSFVKEPFCFPEIFWYRKKLWIRGGISRFSVEIFMFRSAENFRKEILLFLRKFLVSKRFMDKKGGITFFRRKFLVSQCRKISWASLQCFRKFGVSKNFMHHRGYHNFPSKIFCLAVQKNFVGIPSMSQKIWGIEKFYA